MKIFLINNGSGIRKGLSGGTERMLQLAMRLVADGHTLDCVTASGDCDFFEELGLGHCIRINPNPLSGFADTKITRSLWYAYSAFSTLRYFRKARAADVIYAPSDYICDVVPAVILSFLAHKPLAAFIHHACRPPAQRKGLYIINLLSFLAQRFSFALLRARAAKLFFYDTPEGHAIAAKFAGKSIAYGLNGIDPAFHQTCAPLNSHVALFAGGLRPSKGIDALIDLWQQVVRLTPDAVLRIAGGGDAHYTAQVRQRIATLGLANHIVLLGPLSKHTLLGEYAAASMYVACSHEEGWGISIYQALASGHKVFALDLPCYARIADAAHFFAPEQLSSMAQAIGDCFGGASDHRAGTFRPETYYWQNLMTHDVRELAELCA